MVFEGGSDGRWCLKEAAMVWQGSSEQRRQIRELTCSGGRQPADGGGQTTVRYPLLFPTAVLVIVVSLHIFLHVVVRCCTSRSRR
jgi:hypothetical protein